ncbi:hypothetical protein SKAU_G00036470 [Synaphobranchus kaupii]|uniref:Uncharacterized protein n=1 Tax=Synaphobranchus kaupii TaxID=118154 RepID=A0A9Q1GGG2_SYNKA|nr:hypothetical protein SKAU_G00036470 [Synaphobranchus kaupii]
MNAGLSPEGPRDGGVAGTSYGVSSSWRSRVSTRTNVSVSRPRYKGVLFLGVLDTVRSHLERPSTLSTALGHCSQNFPQIPLRLFRITALIGAKATPPLPLNTAFRLHAPPPRMGPSCPWPQGLYVVRTGASGNLSRSNTSPLNAAASLAPVPLPRASWTLRGKGAREERRSDRKQRPSRADQIGTSFGLQNFQCEEGRAGYLVAL